MTYGLNSDPGAEQGAVIQAARVSSSTDSLVWKALGEAQRLALVELALGTFDKDFDGGFSTAN